MKRGEREERTEPGVWVEQTDRASYDGGEGEGHRRRDDWLAVTGGRAARKQGLADSGPR
jgi:hypothetical protein